MVPAQINISALKEAWVSRWKRASKGRPIARVAIMVPSWLRVDRAMIFLRSVSIIADSPAVTLVRHAVSKRRNLYSLKVLRRGWKRMRRKIPAVTSVDEWTSAETGVGAAMAAGSQLEKGICALFVIPASVSIVAIRGVRGVWDMFIINQCPWLRQQAMVRRIITSPMRFLSAVIILAPRDLGFW